MLHFWQNSDLKKEDSQRTNLLLEEKFGLPGIKNQFYQVVNQPLQTCCSVGKFFGGQWLGKCGSFDGNKFVCLDKLYQDVKTGNCLVRVKTRHLCFNFDTQLQQLFLNKTSMKPVASAMIC